jgi:hypothetical protein
MSHPLERVTGDEPARESGQAPGAEEGEEP